MCVCFEDLLVAVTTHLLHGRSAWDRAGRGPLTALTPSLTLSSFPARHPPGLAQGLAGTGARPSKVLVPPIPASHRSPGAPRTHLGVGLVHRGVRATAQALGENETVQPRRAPARASHPHRRAPAAGRFLISGAGFRPGAQNGQRAAVGQNSTLPPAEPAESAARRAGRGAGSPPPPSPAPSRGSSGCSWAPPPPPPALEIT